MSVSVLLIEIRASISKCDLCSTANREGEAEAEGEEEGEETDKLSELAVEYVNVPGTTTISHCRNVNMTNLQSRNSISTNKNQIAPIVN